ncbi:histidine phosphatase family protein [Sulfurimonas sp. C5]|uniref:SixA phosphatase family protein n=1 Tax=Sulfurimonas sp. C5 TaxID=3036947 RepID=UPI0024582090|nr:histidine phosphatase family protein [Sulfurimonas sp. C5]MDH4944349.1 histidine phosphatase family protein [Sulfurimonas sp. C5]
MKKIVLIRHAKSSWKDLTLNDFDRPLNKRGKHDAPMIAEHFNLQNIKLEKIFSSAAKRAKKTAEVFSKTLDVEAEFYKELYGASIDELIEFINKQLQQYNSIAIISHNPELTELSNHISDQYIENIPTSAYVVLECFDDYISEKNCKILDFVYPKREDIAAQNN